MFCSPPQASPSHRSLFQLDPRRELGAPARVCECPFASGEMGFRNYLTSVNESYPSEAEIKRRSFSVALQTQCLPLAPQHACSMRQYVSNCISRACSRVRSHVLLCVLFFFFFFSPAVLGKIRSAVGSAQLLMSQKFQQFRELCEENLVCVTSSSACLPQPPPSLHTDIILHKSS